MEEEILKLKKTIKSNAKFSIICISFIEIMLIVLPLLFNKALPNVTGNVDNLFFIKNYFLKFFPFLSVGLNSYSIKLLFDNKKLNKEVVNLEVLDKKQKIEEEMKQEVKKSMMYEETREVNDDLEFLKYLYKVTVEISNFFASFCIVNEAVPSFNSILRAAVRISCFRFSRI